MKMYFLFITFLLFVSCNKNQYCVSDNEDCENSDSSDSLKYLGKLDTLWTSELRNDNQRTGVHMDLQFLEDKVYATFSSRIDGSISCYDVNGQGEILWEYDQGDRRYFETYLIPDRSLLINKSWRNRLSLNLQTGEEIEYKTSTYTSGPRGIVLGDYLYYDEREDSERTAHLRRCPVSNLSQVESLYTVDNNDIDNSKKSIVSMNLWMDPSTGDSILIFQHRMINRVDVVAWNMDKKEVVWRHDDLTALGNSNHQQITLHDDKAYFAGATAFYCFDMFTGEILWQFDHPSGINSFLFYRPVIAEDENLIIVKDGGGRFRGFDLETGNVRMFNEGSGHSTVSSGSPIYHDGIIYFTERSRLYAVRVATSETLWEESSSNIPLGVSSFQGELAIDRERGILYATSSDRLFAIRVYED